MCKYTICIQVGIQLGMAQCNLGGHINLEDAWWDAWWSGCNDAV